MADTSRAAQLWRRPLRMAGRLGWGVADQAVSSLTNAAVSVYVARELGAVQLGAFSLAYVTYSFALNASRGLATDPLLVRFSDSDLRTWRRAVAACTGTAWAVGLGLGVLVIAAAGLLSGTTRAAFFALGLTLPALLLQDSWRFAFFALRRGARAFVNDLVWAAALIPLLVIIRATGHDDVFWLVLAWGLAAAVAAAVGPLQSGVRPRPSRAWDWLSRHRDLGARYFAEGTTNSLSIQLRTYGVGLIVGLAAVGYVQAAGTLMGPFMVVLLGMGLVTIPEAAGVLRRAPRHLPWFCVLVAVGLSAIGLAWGVVLLVALPRGLGDLLLGPVWRPTYPLVLPLMISLLGGSASAGAGTGLHALGAAKRSLRAMVLSSVVFLGFNLLGAELNGAVGTMQGAAVGGWVGAGIFWWQLRAALREHGREPARSRSWLGHSPGRHRKPHFLRPGESGGHVSGDGRPLIITSILREGGNTGVQTHVRQLRKALAERGTSTTVVTPFDWGGALTAPVFGARLALQPLSGAAGVVWYRHWHEVFLRNALRRRLAEVGDCVLYAQEPVAARAGLRARQGPHQRVVMAVHFRTSQADGWAGKELVRRDGAVFRAIRDLEREVIPRVDRLVYVSSWARSALLSWLPEAEAVPSAVIGNFVAPWPAKPGRGRVGDLVTTGHLEPVKNHRYLLAVLAETRRAGRRLTLDVFGEGPLRKDLERLSRSLGVEEQVRFRGFRTDLRDFLPGYRAYVHASYSESSSLAIIEAMAAGLPVVAADIGPIAELCDDGAEARFWPLDDPGLAAATLIGLLDSEPVRQKASVAARERFRRDFDADVVVPRLRDFLLDAAWAL